MTEPHLFELSHVGRCRAELPDVDVPLAEIPAALTRPDLRLPDVSEVEVVRHYTRLARLNISNVNSLQSSGSCTVKYNPIVNEEVAGLPGFAEVHPYQSTEDLQGVLRVLHDLGNWLSDLTGLPAVTLQPSAGAQAQLAGLLMVRRYFEHRGDAAQRDTVLVTTTAHGSNPASAAMAGYHVVTIPQGRDGTLDLTALRAALSRRVAVFMMTNPNTHGVFEDRAVDVADLVHREKAMLFLDGANLNAIVGKVRVADLGVDLAQLNLHKTFSTPHGGNGPGAGALLVRSDLEPYLPTPVVSQREDGMYTLDRVRPLSIGRVRSFYGQFGILLRAYTYIRAQGASGLRQQAEDAVLHANYLFRRLRDVYPSVYERDCMHEFLVTAKHLKTYGVTARDIGRRLMDYGYHPPNVPPRLVEEGLLIEPTETESVESLDAFADALVAIAREAETNPDLVRSAPHTTPVRRLMPTRPNGVPDVAARLAP